MTIYCEYANEESPLDDVQLRRELSTALEAFRERSKILIVPPDITRLHSRAGDITQILYEMYGEKITDILPALGTHDKLNAEQRNYMFGDIPHSLFRHHDWRNDVVDIGQVAAEHVRDASNGYLDEPWPVQLNRLVWEGGHDLILSVGQVVPHEVVGMANYNKNLLIGTGGKQAINLSHFIGAIWGIEKILGVADNPLRQLMETASSTFMKSLPILYILTVVTKGTDGSYNLNGLFIGDDKECFFKAAALSQRLNITYVERPLEKVVVYLSPREFQSTWLGNKAIYRTRKALADNATLIILAPGVKKFGEDVDNDRLIRQFGYRKTPEVLEMVRKSYELQTNLGVAAHLIHGSTEGRFRVIYCPSESLSPQDIANVGYEYASVEEMLERYNPDQLADGWNDLSDGERIYYISNPAIGLWCLPF